MQTIQGSRLGSFKSRYHVEGFEHRLTFIHLYLVRLKEIVLRISSPSLICVTGQPNKNKWGMARIAERRVDDQHAMQILDI